MRSSGANNNMNKVAAGAPQIFWPRITVPGFVTILALSGMFPLTALAQEPVEQAVTPVPGDSTGTNKPFPGESPLISEAARAYRQSANGAPATTESGNTASQPVNGVPATTESESEDNSQTVSEAPAITEPSGPMSATDKVVARFMGLDTDTSGGVSFEEYMTMVRERAVARYAAMDSNDDGEVTDEEYLTFWKSRMAQWYRLKR